MRTLDMNKNGTQHFLLKLQPGNSQKARKLYQETSQYRHLKNDQTFSLLIVSRKIQTLQSSGHTHMRYSKPITGLDRPKGFQEAEAPRFQDSRHMKVVRLSALRTSCLYPPRNIPGTHFCSRTPYMAQHILHHKEKHPHESTKHTMAVLHIVPMTKGSYVPVTFMASPLSHGG